MRDHGFTLVELLVTVVLFGTVATGAVSLLMAGQRIYRHQTHLMDANATERAAAHILTSELRGLDPGAASGGDLLSASTGSITYRALRNLYVTCAAPSASRSTVLLHGDYLGSRPLDPRVDSILLFADGDPTKSDDDRWLHADLRRVDEGYRCPDGGAGVLAHLAGLSRRELELVGVGAPVRGAALWEIKGYPDSRGDWWVGMRRYSKSSNRWPSIQPLLGPIAPWGLTFRYFDSNGAPTRAPDQVAAIEIAVAVAPGRAAPPHATVVADRWMTARVTLRNALRRPGGR